MRPDVGCEMRAMSFSAVLLPAPFGPMRAKDSPSSTSNETSFSARAPVSRAGRPRALELSRLPTDDEVVTQRSVAGLLALGQAARVTLRDLLEPDRVRHLRSRPRSSVRGA